MDNETKKILSDAENLDLMTQHPGWLVARQMISDKIMDLQFIANVDDSTPEKALIDMKSRKYAVEILFSFLKEDIEGTIAQNKVNSGLPKPINSYIMRLEENR